MIITKQVTNNLIDAFYGQFGWDKKEHVRMKRGQGTWIPVGATKRINQDELDYGCIVSMDAVLPEIIKALNDQYKSKKS